MTIETRVPGPEVLLQRQPDDLVRGEAEGRQARAQRRGEAQLLVGRPQDRGHLLDRQAQPGLALPQGVLGPLGLDGGGDLARDEHEEVPLLRPEAHRAVVGLDGRHPDHLASRHERRPQPVHGVAGDELDLAARARGSGRPRASPAGAGRCAGRTPSGPARAASGPASCRARRRSRGSSRGPTPGRGGRRRSSAPAARRRRLSWIEWKSAERSQTVRAASEMRYAQACARSRRRASSAACTCFSRSPSRSQATRAMPRTAVARMSNVISPLPGKTDSHGLLTHELGGLGFWRTGSQAPSRHPGPSVRQMRRSQWAPARAQQLRMLRQIEQLAN